MCHVCLIEDDLQMSYQKMSCRKCLKDVLYIEIQQSKYSWLRVCNISKRAKIRYVNKNNPEGLINELPSF